MNNGLNCNIEETFDKWCSLAKEDMTRSIKKAISKGAQKLQEQTKENLSRSIKKHNNKNIEKYIDTIEDGVIRTKVIEDENNDLTAKVHIMGTRKPGSGTFRLRFLEKGTKDRYIKTYKGKNLEKPRFAGSIKPKNFFRNANQEVIPQLQSIYMAEIQASIDRVNNTDIQ